MKVLYLLVAIQYAVTSSAGGIAAFVVQTTNHPTTTTNHQLWAIEPQRVSATKKILIPTRSKLTPAQRILQKNRQDVASDDNDDGETAFSEFDKLKSMAYAVTDGLSNLGPGMSTKSSISKKAKVIDGYDGKQMNSAKGDTTKVQKRPTLQLLEMLARRPVEEVNEVPPPAIEPSPTLSVFDTMKGAVYGTADFAASILSSPEPTTTTKSKVANPNLTPVQRASTPEFKMASKPPRLENSRVYREALPDLQSPNPIQRLKAEWTVRDMEFQENLRQQQKEVTEGIDKFKSDVYAVGDFLSSTANEIAATPGRIQSFVQSIPGTVTTIAEKAEQQVVAVKTGVEETVDKTIQVVEEVKAIPTKVRTGVEETVDKTIKVVEEVQAIPAKVVQSVENTKQAVEEVSTSAKVLFGLEKPKPRPPKTPPPPTVKPGASDLAWEVMGSLASVTGKAVFWMGKGAAGVTWDLLSKGADRLRDEAATRFQENGDNAPQLSATARPIDKIVVPPPPRTKPAFISPTVISAASSKKNAASVEKGPEEEKKTAAVGSTSTLKPSPEVSILNQKPVDVNGLDGKLNDEIEEALRLANEALSESNTRKEEGEDPKH